jgi:uroporphyrinogen decarboxylase
MTSRERVYSALQHERPDRTPLFEYVLLSPIADMVLGRPYADYAGDLEKWEAIARATGWRRALERYVADRLDLAQILGHDMLYVCPNPSPPARVTAERAETPSPPADPVERVQAALALDDKKPKGPKDENLLVYHLLLRQMEERHIDLPILAPAYMHGIWTNTDLMQAMLLAPPVAHAHYALATRNALAFIEAYAALGIRLVGIGGDFAGNRPLISPALYRSFIVPEVRACARRIHELSGWAVNASDGNLWSVIEDFLIGCEVDGYLEIDMRAGMDLRALKRAYGERITLFGNMDCGSVLSFSPSEEVRRITRECIQAGAGSGHIFCASNAITGSVPWASYRAMVNAYREIFEIPPLADRNGKVG